MFWTSSEPTPEPVPQEVPQQELQGRSDGVEAIQSNGGGEEVKQEGLTNILDPLNLFGGNNAENDFQKNLNAFGETLGQGIEGGLDNTKVVFEEGFEKALEQEEYYRRYVTTILLNSLNPSMWVNVATIPDIWVRVMSVIAMFVYGAILVYYGYSAFEDGINDTFLSLNPDQGICKTVVKTVDSNLKISIIGEFESSSKFYSNSTAYRIQLAGYSGGEAGFSNLLLETGAELEALSEKGASRPMPWNLIAWATYTQQVHLCYSCMTHFVIFLTIDKKSA